MALGKAISMGEAILAICHPDSITTVKHWNTIIKARFEEVSRSPQLRCSHFCIYGVYADFSPKLCAVLINYMISEVDIQFANNFVRKE